MNVSALYVCLRVAKYGLDWACIAVWDLSTDWAEVQSRGILDVRVVDSDLTIALSSKNDLVIPNFLQHVKLCVLQKNRISFFFQTAYIGR